jgi:hypothetical protein
LLVSGGAYFQGNVGVGVEEPTETLDISGNIKATGGFKIGNTSDTEAGTIRWTGADLEVYNGSAWVSLTSEEAAPAADPNYTDCINVGGSWVNAQGLCYVPGDSCPSGWQQKELYSSTIINSGFGGKCSSWSFRQNSCSTGSHSRISAGIESCGYYA